MILRIPSATCGETQISDVMLNLIDERKIRLKLTVDGKPYDFYVRHWDMEMKGLTIVFGFSGVEVPTNQPIALAAKFDPVKKTLTLSGKFLGRYHKIHTTPGQLLNEFAKLLKNN